MLPHQNILKFSQPIQKEMYGCWKGKIEIGHWQSKALLTHLIHSWTVFIRCIWGFLHVKKKNQQTNKQTVKSFLVSHIGFKWRLSLYSFPLFELSVAPSDILLVLIGRSFALKPHHSIQHFNKGSQGVWYKYRIKSIQTAKGIVLKRIKYKVIRFYLPTSASLRADPLPKSLWSLVGTNREKKWIKGCKFLKKLWCCIGGRV